MGNCRYCGQPAGLFRTTHRECAGKHDQALRDIAGALAHSLRTVEDYAAVASKVNALASASHVSDRERRDSYLFAWESAVEAFLEDGVLDAAEDKRLASFGKQFALAEVELDRGGWLTKLVKAGVLREVLQGSIPQRFTVRGTLPVNLLKGEKILWAFKDCAYLEDKIRRQYVGRSQGWSIRVLKGLYYRTSAFRGHPIDVTVRTRLDSGWVVLTDRNLYFAGSVKSMRIPYSKVVSFEPYTDGVGVMRDAANAKAQVFVTGDGWFTYNLVTNLSQLHTADS